MFWQKELETMSRDQLADLQLKKLKETVARCYHNVPYYQKIFKEQGILPEDIRSLDDLKKLPMTRKAALRENYPFKLLACPMRDVVRIHGSSGTTGKPTMVAYTRHDLDIWSDCVTRVVCAGGATPDDVAQIAFGYGLFTGALGLHQGLEKLGCAVIPMSAGNTEKQLMLMQDLGVTVLIATPSYALYLSEVAAQKGIIGNLKLRIGFFGAEGCTPEMRQKIEENFGIIATDNYGMSELTGPGVSGECEYRCGLHIWEDHFIPEIIDPETGEVLPAGSTGELVVTPLFKEALPLLRYRTGDITRLDYSPCACGRTHVRMEKVQGRSDDMMIIKGVNVFPSQIESVLLGVDQVGPHYLLILRRKNFLDTLEVQIELIDGSLLEDFRQLQALRSDIRARLKTVLGLDCAVTLVNPNTIERFQGKAKRVVDLRNQPEQ
ncbi:MAG: phenylacetate--CoA ligase [Oscillospiraceae bacterium]|nr:phenylacetate--CoA ligase [Oscillospiraceae bacterium]MCM0706112.1 phenylacetate--CoA ligase [Faecalicatena sp. BF-R-105]MDY3219900.1 phenylacetate--CoA ligase [Candidatus Fimivivens sp.]SFI89544.1 phenylacetate-CoA ligase [Ruminococcaceae bacterium D5]GKH51296.1 phenylacetate-coenzyme A ligase [Eubacteriales bacterium]